MRVPPLNRQLVMRIAQAEADFSKRGLMTLEKLPGNPYDISIRSFGKSWALMNKGFPNSIWWNRVMWLEEDGGEFLGEVVDWYRSNGIKCRIEFVPELISFSVFPKLSKLGFFQSEVATIVYGGTGGDVVEESGIETEVVERERIDDFVDLWVEAMVGNRPLTAERMQPYKITLKEKDWHCCVAKLDGKAVSSGAIYCNGDVAYLALVSTLPEYRNRGCQKALLLRGINACADLGCDLIVSGAAAGSVSLYNMHKVGMRTAFNKIVWTENSSKTD